MIFREIVPLSDYTELYLIVSQNQPDNKSRGKKMYLFEMINTVIRHKSLGDIDAINRKWAKYSSNDGTGS